MEKMLVINAHPLVESTSSFTLQVLSRFLKVYRELNPAEAVEQINLYEDPVPMVDRTFLSVWEKRRSGEPMSGEEQQVNGRLNEILRQFKEAVTCRHGHHESDVAASESIWDISPAAIHRYIL